MTFNYKERLEINKNISVKEGIKRAPNSKNKMEYTGIKNLGLTDLAKVLTDIQEKKALGTLRKIDRLTVENWGTKDIFLKYITKNNLYQGTKTSLGCLKIDKLKDIILKEHFGLSPIKRSSNKSSRSSVSPRKYSVSPSRSPVSSLPRKSPVSSPRKRSPVKYEIDPSTKKKRTSCRKNQIRNPKTGRCIKNKNYKSPVSSPRTDPIVSLPRRRGRSFSTVARKSPVSSP